MAGAGDELQLVGAAQRGLAGQRCDGSVRCELLPLGGGEGCGTYLYGDDDDNDMTMKMMTTMLMLLVTTTM